MIRKCNKFCSTIRASFTLPLNSVPQYRALSKSGRDQMLNSILTKEEISTVKNKGEVKNRSSSLPDPDLKKHYIFSAVVDAELPVSNVADFQSLRNPEQPDKIPGSTSLQQARYYVTPDKWADSPAPRGFPRLREPGHNEYQYNDPAFISRQRQIARIKNKFRLPGVKRPHPNQSVDQPPKSW